MVDASQQRMSVEIFRNFYAWRPAGWSEQVLKKPDDILALPDFGLRCKLSDLYRGTPLVPRQPRQRSS